MAEKHIIESLNAYEILDSRGNPTVRTVVRLASGVVAHASVPSGTTTGKHEALELRDGDTKRYNGLGVLKACEHVNAKIIRVLKGFNIFSQRELDEEMEELDKTFNFHTLGANAVLGVSLACARAAAYAQQKPLYSYINELYLNISDAPYKRKPSLPVPLFNIFNGGKHADTNLDFQELMVIPVGITTSFTEQVRAGAEIFHALGVILHNHHLDTDVGSEGGYAPNIDSTMQAFDMIIEAVEHAEYETGKQIMLGVDAGASSLYDPQRALYHFGLIDHDMTSDQLIALYRDWAREYPLLYLEDGLHDDDWANWQRLTLEFAQIIPHDIKKKTGRSIMVVGDDLFVTQTHRLEAGIGQNVANSVIAKPNQVGTLTKTLEFIGYAHQHDYQVVVSHRSGETGDTFIADLAAGVGAEYIKTGSLSRSERVEKYNRLMEIEQELGEG